MKDFLMQIFMDSIQVACSATLKYQFFCRCQLLMNAHPIITADPSSLCNKKAEQCSALIVFINDLFVIFSTKKFLQGNRHILIISNAQKRNIISYAILFLYIIV